MLAIYCCTPEHVSRSELVLRVEWLWRGVHSAAHCPIAKSLVRSSTAAAYNVVDRRIVLRSHNTHTRAATSCM